jgi:acyl-CoA hydrolase
VVTGRADVHYVVTEHGVAYLWGKTLRQRAEALIAIADPRFRDELYDFVGQAPGLRGALSPALQRAKLAERANLALEVA